MRISYKNLHIEGELRSKWDVLLRILGDIEIRVDDRVLYEEAEFCLVEFAIALAGWLGSATDDGPDLVYTSLESETEGLVRFTRVERGSWRVSAADQRFEEPATFSTSQLRASASAYILALRASLQPRVDILDYIENGEALTAIRSWN